MNVYRLAIEASTHEENLSIYNADLTSLGEGYDGVQVRHELEACHLGVLGDLGY